MHRMRRPNGWFLADAIVGMTIVVILTSTLAVAISRQSLGSQRLAESRAATRLAEATLIALQTSQPAPAVPEGAKVMVEPGEALGNCRWATVSVTINRHTSQLSGLVRADAPIGGGK
jgi:type II secretory pathway pseudopilin PulG